VNQKNAVVTSVPFLGLAAALLLGGLVWARRERPGPSGYHVVKTIVVGGPERDITGLRSIATPGGYTSRGKISSR
jgi:hypothetical protein